MSIDNETSTVTGTLSSLNPLKVTTGTMHTRIWFELGDVKSWYAIMKEARSCFGKNWRGQPKVKRKLERNRWTHNKQKVWFDVPDANFATWVAVKHAVTVCKIDGK